MAFTDDPGVQRQAAAESAANIAKDLGIALERIGIKSIEGLSGMREYGTAVPGSGSAIDRFSTAENTSRSKCFVNQRSGLIPSTVARVWINFPSILGVEESAIQRDAFRYRCVISNDMSRSVYRSRIEWSTSLYDRRILHAEGTDTGTLTSRN